MEKTLEENDIFDETEEFEMLLLCFIDMIINDFSFLDWIYQKINGTPQQFIYILMMI